MLTSGDIKETSLATQGGKSLFVKELQNALLTRTADIAVHSIKDLSVNEVPGLCLSAVCPREDPRDVLICPQNYTLMQLPRASIVGTTSPRRISQLLAVRPDLIIKPLRGNVDSRLAKVTQGTYDAIVLAAAGLHRLQLNQYITQYLMPEQFIPAIGQAAIGVEIRRDDIKIQKLVFVLNHVETQQCVIAERAVNQHLGGDCMTPVAAYATSEQGFLSIRGMVGSLDGRHVIRAWHQGPVVQAEKVGFELAEKLLVQGAHKLLS